jgi:AraC-like DNA-binding protein
MKAVPTRSPAQAEAYLQQLLRMMDEKQLYRNSLLTLQDLADEMGISQHHLSQVINTQLGKNFYDFINGYRVDEIKSRLRDPKLHHLTILTIAFEAGFNTKSSFNSFFKKYTGLTPSQYRTQGREAA